MWRLNLEGALLSHAFASIDDRHAWWFWSDADKRFPTSSREQIAGVKNFKDFRAHRSCPLSRFYLSKDRKAVQSVSLFVLQQ